VTDVPGPIRERADLAEWFGTRLGVPLRLAFGLTTAVDLQIDDTIRAACPSRYAERRRRTWLAGRTALARLSTPQAAVAATFPAREISLSHTDSAAAALLVPGGCGCGIDIENERVIQADLHRYFLHDDERARLAADADPVLLWTIKEALFKADLDNADRALTDYVLADPSAATGTARCAKAGGRRFRYAARRIDGDHRLAAAIACA
jgi:hypothetical protein